MPTTLKLRSLQKRTILYYKDDKLKKSRKIFVFFFLSSILQAHSTLSLLLKPQPP